jgi:hypothetical protein
MAIDLELTPKTKRPNGSEPCCEPVVYPDVEREQALRMAEVAKAIGEAARRRHRRLRAPRPVGLLLRAARGARRARRLAGLNPEPRGQRPGDAAPAAAIAAATMNTAFRPSTMPRIAHTTSAGSESRSVSRSRIALKAERPPPTTSTRRPA